MKKFSPMLAIDASNNLENLSFPKLVSTKLDGIRVIFSPDHGIVSRALKPIPNKQIREKFQFMLDHAIRLDRIFDGEFYSHNLTFQEITRAVTTKDFTDPKTISKLAKGLDKLPDDTFHYSMELISKIQFHCFESDSLFNETFIDKQPIIQSIRNENFVPVKQIMVNSAEEVKAMFAQALDDGYEGLILREPTSKYKYGRSTLKEEYMLKVKPFETFDARIIEVQQATEVDPDAEKKTNELGRSVTSRKKDDRVLIEKASAFIVEYNGMSQKVSIAMTDPEKEEVWKNRESYIGRMIEFKGMLIGSKDLIRHPVFVRFRDDK